MKKSEKNTAGKRAPDGFFIKSLSIITLAALIIRLIAAWEMATAFDGFNNALKPLPTSDLATYITLGKECAAGNFPETFYYQPWYYAVFLPLCYLVSGNSLWMVIIVQALLSGATVFLVGWCGKKVFSEKAGLIAAGLTAVSSSLILYVPFHQNETLQTFHLTGLFALTLLALERRKLWLWGVVGLAAGIAILTRGNIWLMVPVILAGLLISGRKNQISWKKLACHVTVFLFFMIVIQLPFIIHNSRAAGKLTGASTAANAVLALGNTPEAPAGGRHPGLPAGAMSYPESYRRMMNNTLGENSRSVPLQMWDWFCDDPLAFCELQFRKLLLFWDGREIPNNVSLDFDGEGTSIVLKLLVFGRNFLIFGLGAAGVLYFLKKAWRSRERNLLMLYGFFFAFYLAVIVFYILSRFKAPVIPLLAVFGGGLLCALFDDCKSAAADKKIIGFGKSFLWILAGFWFSCAAYNTYRQCEPAVNRMIYPDGIVLDMNDPQLHHFDYGPFPFGGWCVEELQPGMKITKKFARMPDMYGTGFAMMLSSREPVRIALLVNGVPHTMEFPAIPPEKTERRMVLLNAPISRGELNIEVLAVEGGRIYAVYDIQRNYNRSQLNNQLIDGEWVIRGISPAASRRKK